MSKSGPWARICFASEQAELDANDTARLDHLKGGLALLANQAEITVNVTGYADTRGQHDFNAILSEKRAHAVASYLSEKIPWTAHKINLIYTGAGEIGPDTPGLRAGDLNDFRIVTVHVDDYHPGFPKEAACKNITAWLKAGIFQEAWGGKVEYGDSLIKLLEIVAANPRMIPGKIYKDSFPDDLLITTDDYRNFEKAWNQEKYREKGGIYDGCSFWNPYPAVKDYVRLGREYLLENANTHSRWRDHICERASYWGKSDGTPDLEKARRQLMYDIENKILPVKEEARKRSSSIDHPCELMEDILIVNDILANAEQTKGTVYHALQDM